MILFNSILVIHFVAFLLYAFTLVAQFPKKERTTGKYGLWLGIAILLSGVGLIGLKYPDLNYYKLVPKTILFVCIAVMNAVYSGRILPKQAYYLLLYSTILASLIALVRV